MFPWEVKKESESEDESQFRTMFPWQVKESESEEEECLGARQCNLVRLSLKSGEKAITLTVQMQNQEELCYRIGMNTKLRFLMMDYCERKGLGFGTIKFIGPDGDGLRESKTPQDLGLEDGDAIDAFDDQMGGNARDTTMLSF